MNKPLLKELIDALQCLPSVGVKSAQRMAYHLLEQNRNGGLELAKVLDSAMKNIGNCQRCRDYTEADLCAICANPKRLSTQVCVVESPSDIAAIESTASYSGNYFVLMGNLSPLDGIGPEEIGLDILKENVINNNVTEVIIATSATVEGEATAHFIKSMLQNSQNDIMVSKIAQGVPIGGELGYLDQSTVSLSLANRQKI